MDKLVGLFQANFKQFQAMVNPDIIEAGPILETA